MATQRAYLYPRLIVNGQLVYFCLHICTCASIVWCNASSSQHCSPFDYCRASVRVAGTGTRRDAQSHRWLFPLLALSPKGAILLGCVLVCPWRSNYEANVMLHLDAQIWNRKHWHASREFTWKKQFVVHKIAHIQFNMQPHSWKSASVQEIYSSAWFLGNLRASYKLELACLPRHEYICCLRRRWHTFKIKQMWGRKKELTKSPSSPTLKPDYIRIAWNICRARSRVNSTA